MTVTAEERRSDGWVAARPLLTYVVLAYGISWSLWWLAGLDVVAPVETIVFTAGIFGPGVAAGLVVWRSGGSVRGWLRPLLRWRVAPRFWVFALGVPAALAVATNGALALAGVPVDLDRLGPAAMSALVWLVAGTPLAALEEELGWRGLALDRLQARHSPLAATVLLGVIWGLWHLPLYGIGVVGPALLAVHFTWLWNRTGSLLLCGVLHAGGYVSVMRLTVDLVDGDLVVVQTVFGVLLAAAVALVVATRGRLGFEHRAEPVAERVADVGRRA